MYKLKKVEIRGFHILKFLKLMTKKVNAEIE